MPPTTTLPELEAALRRLKGLEDGIELEVYEEVKVEPTLMIEQFPADSDLGSNQIEDGDVFIFQERVKPVRPVKSMLGQCGCSLERLCAC